MTFGRNFTGTETAKTEAPALTFVPLSSSSSLPSVGACHNETSGPDGRFFFWYILDPACKPALPNRFPSHMLLFSFS